MQQNSLPSEMSGSVSSGKFLGQVEFLHTLCTPCTTAHPCTCTWEPSHPPEDETLRHEALCLAPITLQAHLRPVCFWSVFWLILLSFGKDKMYCSLFTRAQADGHMSRLWGLVMMIKAAIALYTGSGVVARLCCSLVTPSLPLSRGSACSEAAKPFGKMAAPDFVVTTATVGSH